MGYLLAQEWAALMLSLALAAVRKFMVTELQWLTLMEMFWGLSECEFKTGLYWFVCCLRRRRVSIFKHPVSFLLI